MPSSLSSTAALVGGSALLVAGLGLVSSYQRQYSSAPASSAGGVIADIDDEEDYITEAEVCKIFDKLFLEMQGVLSQLMQQIQQLQMAGQMIPEKQLKGLLKNEMERALAVKQRAVLDQFDIDYDCLEEATWEFLENEQEHPKVKKAVERFQKLWENATGDDVVGWRPGKDMSSSGASVDTLSAERTIEVAEIYFESLTDRMRTLVGEYKADGKSLQDPAVQQALNLDFAKSANDVGEAALEGQGVTLRQFESSVKVHSSNSTVARSLAMLQMKQQQDLMNLGSS